ncbi:periplasmic protein involved in polysaccharide export [Legionella oakridgensis ATCC 33761 = DSM 21215]|uniref:Periplasmic protein involved in polysaccharide export n=1 Tax=Legionella oakridgensis ATCC 33761 = DSM 21215 TaxID=1268635 RepID=W0BA93_9GAMM|nr:polysaccharide biosynthesis/export family protein [Legionella oakridgensis]AHE65621.1 periplasmic protein involved in polysaccharide export [Legionella oakridgensis ATCC 33761 = DSM 21215]
MKKLFLILLIIPTLVWAAETGSQPQGSIFASIDKPSENNNTALSATGFSASSNSLDKSKDNDEEFNIKLKSSTHMGDVLNHKLPVFGQNLFGTQCSQLHQARFFNPEYRLTVGDEVNIQMWGAFQLSQRFPVDTQGNIFIPEVGPVKVEGIENQKLNDIIQQHVKKPLKRG